ncbi:MAG TPA: zf-HC2 domain-containing protein [Ktedonobacteraceae bacterium]|nr:zf-HC2 domain-containing protein [Ktedonobacteraceae bacterium]
MQCKEASRLMQLYIDGRLKFDQIRALEAHITACSACHAELNSLEEMVSNLHDFKFVAEPEDLTAQIMRRVAISPPRSGTPKFSLLRPSLPEILAAVFLATIATLAFILQLPSVRSVLPVANGHDSLSLAFLHTLHLLTSIDIGTLTLVLWIVGTFLGIFITLLFAGNEVRSRWFRAMMARLPER